VSEKVTYKILAMNKEDFDTIDEKVNMFKKHVRIESENNAEITLIVKSLVNMGLSIEPEHKYHKIRIVSVKSDEGKIKIDNIHYSNGCLKFELNTHNFWVNLGKEPPRND
jgi:hypothetical protein